MKVSGYQLFRDQHATGAGLFSRAVPPPWFPPPPNRESEESFPALLVVLSEETQQVYDAHTDSLINHQQLNTMLNDAKWC